MCTEREGDRGRRKEHAERGKEDHGEREKHAE